MITDLVYRCQDGARLKVGAEALQKIFKYRQERWDSTEAGGVMLGRYVLNSDDIIVDNVTEPMPGDKRSRCRFHRAQKRHQELITQAWGGSKGTCTYLGEWHTHPEVTPEPSDVDWSEWRQKAKTDRFHKRIFFLIAGLNSLRVWEGRRGSGIVLEMEVESNSVKNKFAGKG